MNDDLTAERARLHRLLNAADRDPVSKRIGMAAALAQARHLDRLGDIDDTRQLVSVLIRVVVAEQERGNLEATAMAAGELLAVMSDIADSGDEDMAIGVNASAADVSLRVMEIAQGFAQRRRRGPLP